MKIFYLYDDLSIKGGTDKVICDKANYLAEHGYDITIVLEAQMGRPPVFPLSPKVRIIDLRLDFNKQYSQPFLHRLFTYFILMRKYRKMMTSLLSQEEPDIIITTMGRSLDFIANETDGSIKIGEAHTTKLHLRSLHLMESKGGLYKVLAKMMRKKQINNARKLQALILLTPQDANDWADVTKTYVIPNSIKDFPKKVAPLDSKHAIMVGRYNDAKGYEYLVDAWEIVHQKHPDWILDIYGSGELHDDVQRWIRNRHLEKTMLMHEPTDQIMEKYQESSICIVSSRYEGFSMVIVEAMASGVPCVSFDCPFGPRNIIKDGEDGILVEYLNTVSLANGVCELIENETERKEMGQRARVNIRRFSQDTIMAQWEKLFKELISKDENH